MIAVQEIISNLSLIAQGDAEDAQQNLFAPSVRAAVRYADPLAWLAATALARALANAEDRTETVRHATGLIAISEHAPADAIASIAQAATEGFSSPLRYPAANPGSFAGVSCIAHGLRGPTMNLTMPPRLGVPVALLLANSWLVKQRLPLTAVVACGRTDPGKNFARCLLLAAQTSGNPAPLVDAHLQWLTAQTVPSISDQGTTCSPAI